MVTDCVPGHSSKYGIGVTTACSIVGPHSQAPPSLGPGNEAAMLNDDSGG